LRQKFAKGRFVIYFYTLVKHNLLLQFMSAPLLINTLRNYSGVDQFPTRQTAALTTAFRFIERN